MNNQPQSLDEWATYIQGLRGQELYSQAVAANSQGFARTLMTEGNMTMGDIERMMLFFVRQLRATGTKVPTSGAFDLVTMALVDPTARKGITNEGVRVSGDAIGVDDIDTFLLEAAFAD